MNLVSYHKGRKKHNPNLFWIGVIIIFFIAIGLMTSCSSDSNNEELQRITPTENAEILGKWNLDYAVIGGAMHTYTDPGFCERYTSEFKLNNQYTDREINYQTCFVTQYDRAWILQGDQLQKDLEMYTVLELTSTTLKISSNERSFIRSYTRAE